MKRSLDAELESVNPNRKLLKTLQAYAGWGIKIGAGLIEAGPTAAVWLLEAACIVAILTCFLVVYLDWRGY